MVAFRQGFIELAQLFIARTHQVGLCQYLPDVFALQQMRTQVL